jgi:phospholipase/lecithinase/hemolysin
MKKLSILFTLLILLFTPLAVRAYPYSSILSFGDSLTDNGYATDGFGLQYFTNGPVWVEYMSTSMGVPLFDMAFGGATTDWNNPAFFGDTRPLFGLQWQVNVYIHPTPTITRTVPADTLVTIWAGANDFFDFVLGDNHCTPIDPSQVVTNAVSNLVLAIQTLKGAGATDFLIPSLPDIGSSPSFRGTGQGEYVARSYSLAFNTALTKAIAALEVDPNYHGVNFYIFDVYDLIDAVIANPTAYKFDNVTGEWILRPAGDTSRYLFWDGVHPTTQAHSILAQDVISELRCPCDVNHDGKCNLKDDVLFSGALLKFLLSKGTNYSGCDLNGDGKCDQIDINLYRNSMKSGYCPCR